MSDTPCILLVDDEEEQRFMWEKTIARFGYEIHKAESGQQALDLLNDLQPDLVLLDLKMPGLDGHQTAIQIKNQPKYMNLPIIILTSSDDLNDKLNSFEEGADDYITKEMDSLEIGKRIQTVLRRYRQNLDSNPLTRLPGNNAIMNVIQKRIDETAPLAVCYCDLDNFKAYNDKYGFVEGDRIILFTAEVLQRAITEAGQADDFLGHIGGDDFVVLTTPDRAEQICQFIMLRLEESIGQFYSEEERQAGFILSVNRQGEKQKFPLISISIAIVSNQFRALGSLAEISRIAGELKKLAKKQAGNSYVFDKRTQ